MRLKKTRVSDSTFDLNLAPFLDIIVSVVPLLLLSVVFVEIKMLETPVPQVVQNMMELDQKDPDPEVNLNLRVSKTAGFLLVVTDKGKTQTITVPLKGGSLDFDGLYAKTADLKRQYPEVFRLGLAPDGAVPFKDLVHTMDTVRKITTGSQKFAVTDKASGKRIETDLMFPNVTFSNVVGE